MFKQLPLAISPNIKSTFDSYYISEANTLAISNLRHFLSESDEFHFYLWGPEAVGITHLLEASQHNLSSHCIQYLPLKLLIQYSPELITEGMEYLDMVFVDDIEMIAGHTEWELAFFHLFNRLRDCGKRIVIGSHCSPRQLPVVLADLKSRLQWGVVFHLDALDDDEKIRAIIHVAEKLGMELPEELGHYLLQRTSRSTRQLFNLVEQLDKASLSEQRKLTIPFAKKALGLSA